MDALNQDWVLTFEYGELELHCRQASHPIEYRMTVGSPRRSNRWSVEAANDIGATVCAKCLWRVLPPGTLAFVYGAWSNEWGNIPWD